MLTSQQKNLIGLLLVCLLFLTFWIRIQGVERFPNGQFSENDAFLFHWQSGIIAKQGKLPAKDLHRWLPDGRDNQQMLSLYPYTIAYIHRVLPWFSLYHIQLYLPVLCFTFGLGVLFLFLTRMHGILFALIVAVLLATLPGSIERSSAGFGDRDAWCWMLGMLATVSYLWKDQIPSNPYNKKNRWVRNWRRYLGTTISGFIVLLGGLSWEAFGFFVLIILTIELMKFCTTNAEENLDEYLIWLLLFVPWLYLISPAYREGYGSSKHVAALMLLVPLTVFALRGIRYLILKFYEPLRVHGRKLAWGLTLFGIAAGAVYIFFQYSTFTTTAFTVFENELMKNVGELADPSFRFWHRRYGGIFILGSIGLIGAGLQLWRRNGISLAFSLSLFTATTFFRWQVSDWIGSERCNILFLISLGLVIISLGTACLRKTVAKNELVAFSMFSWFLLWVALARGGKRFDFFIGLPLAYGTAWLLDSTPAYIIQWIKDAKSFYPRIKPNSVTGIVVAVVLIPVLFLNPFGGHVTRSGYAASGMQRPSPGIGTPLADTLEWIKTTLPPNSVVAANWGYGIQLNVLGGVKTIIDSDHFLPHRIPLYYRHVFCAQNTGEALRYLKTHGATHLMLTERDVTSSIRNYSTMGSKQNDRRFNLTDLLFLSNNRLSNLKHIPFLYIEAPENVKVNPPDYLTAYLKDGSSVHLPYAAFIGEKRKVYKAFGNEHGGIILFYDDQNHRKKAYYLPPVGWRSVSIRLYFFGELSNIFVPVYATDEDDITDFKIWKINYPPDVKVDNKYLTNGLLGMAGKKVVQVTTP
ncbi:hypothetical protein J5I95_22585 [Candidatus Poribacteria bacterium]|nr:hypothetical protein [Candidatus Poribacteria bacterium]